MDAYRNSAALLERLERLEDENVVLRRRSLRLTKLEGDIVGLRARLRRYGAVRGLEMLACCVIVTMGIALVSTLLKVC